MCVFVLPTSSLSHQPVMRGNDSRRRPRRCIDGIKKSACCPRLKEAAQPCGENARETEGFEFVREGSRYRLYTTLFGNTWYVQSCMLATTVAPRQTDTIAGHTDAGKAVELCIPANAAPDTISAHTSESATLTIFLYQPLCFDVNARTSMTQHDKAPAGASLTLLAKPRRM